jgi:hypothetical protein
MSNSPSTVRFPPKQEQEFAKLNKKFGVGRSTVVQNAVDLWLRAFERAPEAERLKMLLRPKATGRASK